MGSPLMHFSLGGPLSLWQPSCTQFPHYPWEHQGYLGEARSFSLALPSVFSLLPGFEYSVKNHLEVARTPAVCRAFPSDL